MACQSYSLTGIGQECAGAVAGLKKLYFGLLDDVSAITFSAGTQMVTNFELKTGKKLYEYFVTDESSSLNSTMTRNSQQGTLYFTNTINATFIKMTPAKNLEMQALANEKLIVIAEDNNNQNWLLGADSFATANEITAQSGQAFDDLSGYQIVINHRSGYLAMGINKSDYESYIQTN